MKQIVLETIDDALEPVVGTAAICVRNSLGPIQSLKPDGFRDATRTK